MCPCSLVQRVAQHLDYFDHGVDVVKVEAESVPVGGLVKVSAAHAVPNGHIGIDLCGDELRQSAQAGHGLAVLEAVEQMFSRVGVDGLQVLDFSLVDQVPDDCVVQVEVAHDLAACDQLCDGVVADLDVVLVRAEGNGPEQPVLREGVLEDLVGVLDSGEGGDAGLELGPQFGVVQDPQGAGSDVVDYVLFDPQEERLALIDKDLGHILIHDDGALDDVLGEVLYFDGLVDLDFLCGGGDGHLVGLDLADAVLPPQVSAEVDQVADLLLDVSSGVLREVLQAHDLGHLDCAFEVALLEVLPHVLRVVELLAHLLRQLLHHPVLHVHQLVLQRNVARLAHVQCDYQPFDEVVLGLEVFKRYFLEGIEDLEVFSVVLHNCSQWLVLFLCEDLVVAESGEGTGHRHIHSIVASADDVADTLRNLEAILFGLLECLVASLDTRVINLSVSDQNNLGVPLLHDFSSNVFGAGPSSALLGLDPAFEFLERRCSACRVPQVKLGDIFAVLRDDVLHCFPIVG